MTQLPSKKLKFYLSGQTNFGNRGCEALVRSTIQLLKEEFGDIEVLIPSYHPQLDAGQWSEHDKEGCRFVRAMPYPIELKLWGKFRKLMPFIKDAFIPGYSLPKDIKEDIAECDVVLLIGGDNITLDYGVESLVWHIHFAQHALRMEKKLMIWGASIGPFSENPTIERYVTDFLSSVDKISVRETISYNYLQALGIKSNVSLVSDSAFIMEPQPLNIEEFWPSERHAGTLGFNISPLIQKFRPTYEHPDELIHEVANFLIEVIEHESMSVLLIPHVDPLDGKVENSDSYYMEQILALTGDRQGRIKLVPNGLNAAQLKYVLSKCTYFIGARTHSTIGALSCFVPTVSIAYSIKAKGLNRDLFGNEDLVLNTSEVSLLTLKKYLNRLLQNNQDISNQLAIRIPEWRAKTRISPQILSEII